MMMMASLVLFMQELPEGVIADKSLFYILVGLVTAIISVLCSVIAWQARRIDRLESEKTEMSKAGTEALATFGPLIKQMDDRTRETFMRMENAFSKGVEEIKSHINLLKNIG